MILLKNILVCAIIMICANSLFGQHRELNHFTQSFDSVVIYLVVDHTFELDIPNYTPATNGIEIKGRAKLDENEIQKLHKRIKRKRSYGSSQAMTPIYDLTIGYFNNGESVAQISICLWTNNLFSTFPLTAQRQGECMCDGDGGYCCSKGGISRKFKKYLIRLLQKNQIPLDQDEIKDILSFRR